MQWKVLAGLRFVLAWIVVCYHLRDYVPNYGQDFLCQFGKLNGLAAVFGFLLISGYSIAHSLDRKQSGFYQRRLLRIYPLYVCAILVTVLVTVIGLNERIKLSVILGNLLFLQNFFIETLPNNSPLWTLSMEVFCYVLAPLFNKIKTKYLLFLVIVSACLYGSSPYLYRQFFPEQPYPFPNHWFYGLSWFMVLWAWLLGFVYFKNNQHNSFKFLLIFIGITTLTVNQEHTGKFGIITYMLSSIIIIYADKIKLYQPISNCCNYLGEISYPLYLFHIPVLVLGYSILKITNSVILVGLAMLITIMFYHVIDVCLLKRKITAISKKES